MVHVVSSEQCSVRGSVDAMLDSKLERFCSKTCKTGPELCSVKAYTLMHAPRCASATRIVS
jgi:hypothetical protein